MTVGKDVWLAGDASLGAAVLAMRAAAGSDPSSTARRVIQTNRRRTLERIVLPSKHSAHPPAPGSACVRAVVLKTHHLATGRHPVRERLKRALGRSPARREWQALEALHAAGVAVPRPLAFGRAACGDEWLVCEALDGEPLVVRHAGADEALRERLLAALVETLGSLFAAGYVHGDLHLGNLHGSPDPARIFLLDLQRARRPRGARARAQAQLEDLADLELALSRAGWSARARAMVRSGVKPKGDFDAALVRRAADRVRGRARRSEARLPRVRFMHAARTVSGRRDASLEESTLERVLALAAASGARRERRAGRSFVAEVECAARAFVVKWSTAGTLLDRLVAGVRGTPAARAFQRGLRARLLTPLAARPLAHLETRSLGVPGESWLVMERVGDRDLDATATGGPTQRAPSDLAHALGDALADLHALGLDHRDLKGSNLRVAEDARGQHFWLVDLEDLRGPARVPETRRIDALAALNASLADEDFDTAFREAVFARYCARLPFRGGTDAAGRARREILRRSLARRHRFRGADCDPRSGPGGGVRRP